MAETLIPDNLAQLAYQTLQQGKAAFSLAHKTVASRTLNAIAPFGLVEKPSRPTRDLPSDVLAEIRQRYDDILKVDWADAEAGVYPKTLLFDDAWDDFVKFYPAVCFDVPLVWNRSHGRGGNRDFSNGIETEGLPNYYTQNFHHQTDGYLSDRSAQIYDIQVELLFNGAADAMRRRILAPLKQALTPFADEAPQSLRVLDIACGTGRTLRMIRQTLPKAKLYGIDLSEAYLRKANQLLSQLPGELPQLAQSPGEALPYQDNYFHALSCVFLFHELPAPIRQQVIDEAFRVVKPGGSLVICDSIQLSDSPNLEATMEGFPEMFHEPFYRNYTQDDITDRLTKAGFVEIEQQVHFMSKYWIAKKAV